MTIQSVLNELKRGPEPHMAWRARVRAACKGHLIDESEQIVQLAFGGLAQLHAGSGAIPRKLDDIDLIIMGCSEAFGVPIVTRDGPMAQACASVHVKARAILLPDFFRQMGWTFP